MMRKVLIGWVLFLFLWILGVALYNMNVFLTIKYTIEGSENDALVEQVYSMANTYLILHAILLAGSFVFTLILFFILRRHAKQAVRHNENF